MTHRNAMQVWGMPLVVSALSLAGLLTALFLDGMGDLLSWMALGLPVVIGVWYAFKPERARH